jgi:elongation factor P
VIATDPAAHLDFGVFSDQSGHKIISFLKESEQQIFLYQEKITRGNILPKASDLKQNMLVDINDEPYSVKKIEVRNPTSRGASTLYKVRFAHLVTKQKLDESFKGDDFLKEADCERVSVQFSYQDGAIYYFMNLESYEQYGLNADDIDRTGYLTEGLEGIIILLRDGAPLGLELPASVALEIIETAPGIKGSSATSRTKPAKLITGIEVQVPEYIEVGEVIKINTGTGKYMSKA